MSKRMPAEITCSGCGNKFEVSLYRTIWIEQPENRKLIFEDKVNAVTCPKCKKTERLKFPFLCTNIDEHIAVWYEPYPDPVIDEDMKQYAKHFGAASFYATAPRVRDWQAFKAKIVELEQRTGMKPAPKMSPEMGAKMSGFVEHIRRQQVAAETPTNSTFTKSNIAFHAQIVLFAPAVFYLAGAPMFKLAGSAPAAWISGIVACALSWRYLGRIIRWVSSGANIPVTAKDQRGIERLGFVCGLVSAPIAALLWYSYAERELSSSDASVFFTLPVAISTFLLAKIIVRTIFWIRDGFNSAP